MLSTQSRFEGVLGSDFEQCTIGIPHYTAFREQLINLIVARYSSKRIRILDIGAGTGSFLRNLSKRELSFEYVGVESSKCMYQKLSAIVSNTSYANCVLSDALTYLAPLDPNEFDVVINSWTFHNWDYEYRIRVLKHVYRILKPNGHLLICDKIAMDDCNAHAKNLQWQMKYVKEVFAEREDIINEWTQHYTDDEDPKIVWRFNSLVNNLKKTGFVRQQFLERKFMDILYYSVK